MDAILYAIIGLFVGWEGYAHYVAKNKEAHTLSNRIWALEHKYPWARVVVYGLCALLSVHLTMGWL